MSHEMKHPLALRGRDLPDRVGSPWQSVMLIVHKTGGNHCLVSLVVTDRYGSKCKDTRLGECWVVALDSVGRPLPPMQMLAEALSKLVLQPGARLLPDAHTLPA